MILCHIFINRVLHQELYFEITQQFFRTTPAYSNLAIAIYLMPVFQKRFKVKGAWIHSDWNDWTRIDHFRAKRWVKVWHARTAAKVVESQPRNVIWPNLTAAPTIEDTCYGVIRVVRGVRWKNRSSDSDGVPAAHEYERTLVSPYSRAHTQRWKFYQPES